MLLVDLEFSTALLDAMGDTWVTAPPEEYTGMFGSKATLNYEELGRVVRVLHRDNPLVELPTIVYKSTLDNFEDQRVA